MLTGAFADASVVEDVRDEWIQHHDEHSVSYLGEY
jgi:hypothetical protein